MNQPPYSYDDVIRAKPLTGKVKFGEVEAQPIFDADPSLGPYGVIYSDKYVTLVRDPITLPNYSPGAHVRVIEGDPAKEIFGAIILPLRPNADGDFDIGWVRQWRHPVSGWMTELPRGGTGSGESPAAGALRELREETGLRNPDLMLHLGDLAINSGICSSINSFFITIYLGHARMIQREKQDTEAISSVIWAPFSKWKDIAFTPGVPDRPVASLDMFTSAAFGLAFMTGYLRQVQSSWKGMYEKTLLSDGKVTNAVKHELQSGSDSFNVKILCSDSDTLNALTRELPLVEFMGGDTREEVRAAGISLLTLYWIGYHPGVIKIDSFNA